MGTFDNTYYRQVDGICRLDQYKISQKDTNEIKIEGNDLTNFLRKGLAFTFEESGNFYQGYFVGTPTLNVSDTEILVLLNDSSGNVVSVPSGSYDNFKVSSNPGFGDHSDFINFNPALVGWSTNPVKTVYNMRMFGRKAEFTFRQADTKTSNSNTASISLPVAVTTDSNYSTLGDALITDNGVTKLGRWFVGSGDTAVSFNSGYGGGNFTSSGAKRIATANPYFKFDL